MPATTRRTPQLLLPRGGLISVFGHYGIDFFSFDLLSRIPGNALFSGLAFTAAARRPAVFFLVLDRLCKRVLAAPVTASSSPNLIRGPRICHLLIDIASQLTAEYDMVSMR